MIYVEVTWKLNTLWGWKLYILFFYFSITLNGGILENYQIFSTFHIIVEYLTTLFSQEPWQFLQEGTQQSPCFLQEQRFEEQLPLHLHLTNFNKSAGAQLIVVRTGSYTLSTSFQPQSQGSTQETSSFIQIQVCRNTLRQCWWRHSLMVGLLESIVPLASASWYLRYLE